MRQLSDVFYFLLSKIYSCLTSPWKVAWVGWECLDQVFFALTPGAGVAGCCEPPDVDAGSQTQTFCKGSVCSGPLNAL